MENLTYVTGNYGKYVSVKRKFLEADILIHYFKCDLEELEINDIKLISQKKAKDAYELVKSPVFVADSGFYIEDYPNDPGYPGAFVKRSRVSSDIDHLLEVMKEKTNRNCYFLDCLTFYDGEEFYQFFGKCSGTLANEKRGNKLEEAMSNLWYVFVPNHCTKTLAEMTQEERENRQDGRTSATMEFLHWYQTTYSKRKQLIKK